MLCLLTPRIGIRIAVVAACLLGAQQASSNQPLQPPKSPARWADEGKATTPWHSLRLRWRTEVGRDSLIDRRVTDMQRVGDVLYYVGNEELGAVSIETGKLLWQRTVPPRKETPYSFVERRDWQLTIAGSLLVLADTTWSSPLPEPLSPLLAFRTIDGAPLWAAPLKNRPTSRALSLDGVLLVADASGDVQGVREADGKPLWSRSLYEPTQNSSSPSVQLAGEGGICVAQLGGRYLEGFAVQTGQKLWAVPAVREAEQGGDSKALSVDTGSVYATLASGEVLAVEVATGKVRWRHSSADVLRAAGTPLIVGDQIVVLDGNTSVGLDRETGKRRWSLERVANLNSFQAALVSGQGQLLVKSYSPPNIQKPPQALLTIPRIDTLTALNPKTGQPEWQWQPEEGIFLQSVLVNGSLLLATDGSELFCYEPGSPAPLPTDPQLRRRLAAEIADRLFVNDMPHRTSDGKGRFPLSSSERNEAYLRLIRLGAEATPTLLALLPTHLQRSAKSNRDFQRRQRTNVTFRDGGQSLTNLLVDIGDPAAVPALLALANSPNASAWQDDLATTLIRFGDRRAAAWLFRYSGKPNAGPTVRESALRFACRAGDQDGLRQSEVTSYLLAQIANPAAPSWLRRMARIELLNDRGPLAAKAALSRWKTVRRARLLPSRGENVTSEKSAYWTWFDFGKASSRGANGTYWTVGTSELLDEKPTHLWAAHSRDGKSWMNPVFVEDFSPLLTSIEKLGVRISKGQLQIQVEGTKQESGTANPVRMERSLTPTSLYLDSDRDRLPDRLERQIGSNPHQADTNGNGIVDGEDKNPTYLPHQLTEQEGIYQAVLEALCQLAATAEPASGRDLFSDVPRQLSQAGVRLIISLPPGSRGVEILGHAGPILYRNGFNSVGKVASSGFSSTNFTPPSIGLDGVWNERSSWYARPQMRRLSFAHPLTTTTFREAFPYELSSDGTRARIGWREFPQGSRRDFDVEVRKIAGIWRPIECRVVSSTFRIEVDHVLTPVRPLH